VLGAGVFVFYFKYVLLTLHHAASSCSIMHLVSPASGLFAFESSSALLVFAFFPISVSLMRVPAADAQHQTAARAESRVVSLKMTSLFDNP
jgi:hypothetical protein